MVLLRCWYCNPQKPSWPIGDHPLLVVANSPNKQFRPSLMWCCLQNEIKTRGTRKPKSSEKSRVSGRRWLAASDESQGTNCASEPPHQSFRMFFAKICNKRPCNFERRSIHRLGHGDLFVFCSLKSKSPWNRQGAASGCFFSTILFQCYKIPGDYSPINNRLKCSQNCPKCWEGQQNDTCGLPLGIFPWENRLLIPKQCSCKLWHWRGM